MPTKTEFNYSTTAKKWLAGIFSITMFLPHLFGKPVSVVTSHNSLCLLAGLRQPSGRLVIWRLRDQERHIRVPLKLGRKLGNADYSSRAPGEPVSAIFDDNDDEFLGAVSGAMISWRQLSVPEILAVLDQQENKSGDVLQAFSGALIYFCVGNNVLYIKNITVTGKT